MDGESEKEKLTNPVSDPLTSKGRRRIARKSTKGAMPKKLKVTYYLTGQAIERVGVAATMEHLDKSEVIELLIQAHLRKWVVSCRGQRPEEIEDERGGAGGRSLAG